MGDTDGGGEFMRVGMGLGSDSTSSSSQAPIDSSNIGFQLLKKHGWKEGTGLGISEQGRLEPVEAFLNKNKRGLGAEKMQKPQKSENAQLLGADRKNDKDARAERVCKNKLDLFNQRFPEMYQSSQSFYRVAGDARVAVNHLWSEMMRTVDMLRQEAEKPELLQTQRCIHSYVMLRVQIRCNLSC